MTTKYVTNRVIAWSSTAHSLVRTSGAIRFVPSADGGTCIKVALDYAVVAGSLVDAIAALAVPSRARAIESDIRRLPEQLALASAAHPAMTSG